VVRTVRLPVYQDGIETTAYLELNVDLFVNFEYGWPMPNDKARVVPMPVEEPKAKVEWLDVAPLHPTLTREELQMLSAASPEEIDTTPTVEEWIVIESLPIRSFEINRHGDIRHRASKRLMEQEFDIDQKAYRTILKINGTDYTIDSRRMADGIWNGAQRG